MLIESQLRTPCESLMRLEPRDCNLIETHFFTRVLPFISLFRVHKTFYVQFVFEKTHIVSFKGMNDKLIIKKSSFKLLLMKYTTTSKRIFNNSFIATLEYISYNHEK